MRKISIESDDDDDDLGLFRSVDRRPPQQSASSWMCPSLQSSSRWFGICLGPFQWASCTAISDVQAVLFRPADLIGIFSERCRSHSFFEHVLSTIIFALLSIRWLVGIGKFVWSRGCTALSTVRCHWLVRRSFSELYARKLPVLVRSLLSMCKFLDQMSRPDAVRFCRF